MGAYLVTGGAGFIGSHIVEALVRKGERVRVLDNLTSGKIANLAASLDRIEFIEGDIRDPEACRAAAAGMDHILHQAALVSVPLSVEDPRLAHDINVTGTLNMLIAARDAGARSFVLASSSSVYGDSPDLPNREGREGNPLSPYAAGKRTGEYYCGLFRSLHGLKTTALRYFNVFGPRQDPGSAYAAVIPRFIGRILRGEPPVIYGDGGQSRDFVYASDVAAANLAAAAGTGESGVFNVAGGRGITVQALAEKIAALLGSTLVPVYEAERPGDIRHSFADVALAERQLKFKPKVSLDEGLALTVRWHRERSRA
jgi:UDP-glucose 4-epimerase